MKVCLIFREARPGYFSIEEVFKCIRQELEGKVEFVEFKADINKSRLANLRAARKVKADVYHITGDCNYIAIGLKGRKTILTVHDIAHYEYVLTGWRRWLFGWLWWRIPMQKVAAITSVSAFTKSRLQAVFGVRDERISVLYNPMFKGFYPGNRPFNAQCPRILQIGNGVNKNIHRLIDAVAGIPCHLVLINRLLPEVKKKLEAAGVSYEAHQQLSQQQMQEQYRAADMLFFASLYEGFGLPIIEAYASGIPVITSNVSSMLEIAGDGAMLVDPWSVDEIRKAIIDIIQQPEWRERLVMKGKERVKDFYPATIAHQYQEQYQKVYQQNIKNKA